MNGMGAPRVWVVMGQDKEEVWFTGEDSGAVDPGTCGFWNDGEVVVEGRLGEEADLGASSLQIEGKSRDGEESGLAHKPLGLRLGPWALGKLRTLMFGVTTHYWKHQRWKLVQGWCSQFDCMLSIKSFDGYKAAKQVLSLPWKTRTVTVIPSLWR